jgi:hypothetical protein
MPTITFASDAFSRGTIGDEITRDPGPEIGPLWKKITSNAQRIIVLGGGTATGMARQGPNFVGSIAVYVVDSAAPSADYTVTGVFQHKTATFTAAVVARATTNDTTAEFYYFLVTGNNARIHKVTTAGGDVGISTTATVTAPTLGVPVTLTLRLTGTLLEGFYNGGGPPVCSVTDATLAGAGRPGVRVTANEAAPSDTAGLFIESFAATYESALGAAAYLRRRRGF